MAAGRRNLQLDVLRGIAILLVLGRHLGMPKPGGLIGAFAEGWFRIGWLGVDLFFVLSGFLIGGLLIDELGRHGKIDITRFLIRRGLKIYPAYYVFLAYLIAMPVAKAIVGGGDPGAVLGKQWILYWPNFLFLQNYVGSNPAGHTWTLAVEEHFYLVLPFVIWLLVAAGRPRMLIVLCGAATVLFLVLRWLSVATEDAFSVRMAATHLRLDALLCGVGIRAVAQHHPGLFSSVRNWRAGLIVAGILCWMPFFFVEPKSPGLRVVGLSATYLGSAAFLLAAYHTHQADFGRRVRVVTRIARLVAWIGVYSYAIYLWHITAIGILEREVGSRIIGLFGSVNGLTWVLAVLVVGTGAVFAGMLMSKLVDWPVLRFRDRVFPSRSRALSSMEQPHAEPGSPLRTELSTRVGS